MRTFLFAFGVFFAFNSQSQTVVENQLSKKMDQGVALMNAEQYEGADEIFVYVIKSMSTLPSELAYYFGRNSYYLQKHKQSINWLNKYIQLKGTSGRFHQDAVKHLRLAEEKLIGSNTQSSDDLLTELETEDYDCGGLDRMICPVCKGEGVIFKRNPFETLYKTCTACKGDAYLSCKDYNLFMVGRFDPEALDTK